MICYFDTVSLFYIYCIFFGYINEYSFFQVVQCRQSASTFHGFLSEWASFILIDNHTYLKLLYRDQDQPPTWFCILRISSKFPCVVLNIGFCTGTPGSVRLEVREYNVSEAQVWNNYIFCKYLIYKQFLFTVNILTVNQKYFWWKYLSRTTNLKLWFRSL